MQKKINQILKENRLRKQLTQKELGELMGMGKSTLSLYENGKISPTVDQLEKYAKAFGMELRITFKEK